MFKCPYCETNLKTISSLKRHIIKMHLQHNGYCPFCKEKFKNFESLQFHLRLNIDDYHQNLYYLLTKKYMKFVDKKLFLSD